MVSPLFEWQPEFEPKQLPPEPTCLLFCVPFIPFALQTFNLTGTNHGQGLKAQVHQAASALKVMLLRYQKSHSDWKLLQGEEIKPQQAGPHPCSEPSAAPRSLINTLGVALKALQGPALTTRRLSLPSLLSPAILDTAQLWRSQAACLPIPAPHSLADGLRLCASGSSCATQTAQ